jgi:hypothetical protein
VKAYLNSKTIAQANKPNNVSTQTTSMMNVLCEHGWGDGACQKVVHEIKMQGKCASDFEEVMCLLEFK